MNRLTQSSFRPVIYWLLSGCFLIYALVVIGCLTRLTHSGLSITDWSFMGSMPPLNDEMWLERFQKYQQSPEYKKVNFEMSLDEFKPIFMWEYVHRLTARLMMYVFAVGLIYLAYRKKITRPMWPWLLILVALGGLQGLIGWWMVASGLSSQPAVSHYRLAMHLLSAFTVFAFTWWFTLKLIFRELNQQHEGKKLRVPALIFLFTLVAQIIYGAFTAGFVEGNAAKLRPGHIFNTWPKMGTEWIPEQVYMKESLFANLLENPSGIQFVHRYLAVIVVVALCVLWYRSNKLNLTPQQNKGVSFLIYGVTIQFILGVLTLIYNVPVVMGVLHQTGAFFLFAATVYLLFHLYNKPTVSAE